MSSVTKGVGPHKPKYKLSKTFKLLKCNALLSVAVFAPTNEVVIADVKTCRLVAMAPAVHFRRLRLV